MSGEITTFKLQLFCINPYTFTARARKVIFAFGLSRYEIMAKMECRFIKRARIEPLLRHRNPGGCVSRLFAKKHWKMVLTLILIIIVLLLFRWAAIVWG
ncbi:small membrane protein YniD [Lonsdalea quercina]|uniref:small membrane protein YniD n=1 Tax=Lonsdalea quercina TaxID=71657 RepID=UPI0039764C43